MGYVQRLEVAQRPPRAGYRARQPVVAQRQGRHGCERRKRRRQSASKFAIIQPQLPVQVDGTPATANVRRACRYFGI